MMMSEQQFILDKLYYTIMTPIEKISVGRSYMTYREVVDLLNEQQATIEELQQKYDKLCIEMANIYSKYIFMKEFSEDTNPNEAVKYVLRELMQKTKEVR